MAKIIKDKNKIKNEVENYYTHAHSAVTLDTLTPNQLNTLRNGGNEAFLNDCPGTYVCFVFFPLFNQHICVDYFDFLTYSICHDQSLEI